MLFFMFIFQFIALWVAGYYNPLNISWSWALPIFWLTCINLLIYQAVNHLSTSFTLLSDQQSFFGRYMPITLIILLIACFLLQSCNFQTSAKFNDILAKNHGSLDKIDLMWMPAIATGVLYLLSLATTYAFPEKETLPLNMSENKEIDEQIDKVNEEL